MMRTHGCGELKEPLIGQTVTLCGWLHRRRDHGGLSFFDVRDRSGIAQVVLNAKTNAALHQQAKGFGPEYVLKISGAVQRRPKGTENPKLPSGMVEVAATDLVVLNPAVAPPFEIDDHLDISEDVRMQWRYLDLRRPASQHTLLLRHRIISRIRQALDGLGFIEVETPMLTKSTPEGARDYLVPSRVNPGKFFALPQSPQLFKQLLMVAGLERYFQVARCFRDEDLRADRQPEFTQLDLEMSFVEEDDVFGVIEGLVADVFQDALGITLPTPFPRLSYEEAQRTHHTDKPNLRGEQMPWAFCWVTSFPLFHWNPDTKRWDAEHHPFTAPHPEDLALLSRDPGKVRSRAYDLVLNGVELGSGSIRIHQAPLQQQIFQVLGMSEQTAEERFGFLLQAFAYGAPPHGGFALGLDRLIAMVAKRESIREVIAFPKTQKAACPVTGAPAHASKAQLKELGIALAPESPSA
ncbi:MAG TPA: aspartate--tRNA ligase [Candidatus Omnitrophica bacterium]|nr:aspartate--tRNA ligase [Candidatus Omnitrophota bacterium]HBH96350.1 aspartate--tRNA ligase [Candidatus Omnitrophota bacterium]